MKFSNIFNCFFKTIKNFFINSMVVIEASTIPLNLHCVLTSLRESAHLLIQEGAQLPSWVDMLHGTEPRRDLDSEQPDPGEWKHGWQFYTSSRREHFSRTILLSHLDGGNAARLRSCAGPHTSSWMTAIPKDEACRMLDTNFVCAFSRKDDGLMWQPL